MNTGKLLDSVIEQGVIDILRDQLQKAGDEAIELKAKINTLEESLALSTQSLEFTRRECDEQSNAGCF